MVLWTFSKQINQALASNQQPATWDASLEDLKLSQLQAAVGITLHLLASLLVYL